MSVNLRYPNITGRSEKEQITQIKSYLHQLVDQMNYALTTIGSGDATAKDASSQTNEVQGGEISYYELKSIIIQEQQKLDTLFDQLSQKMQSDYVSDEELPAAVEEALAQAKASGEFDGEDGHTPEKGVDYFTEEEKAEMVRQVWIASEDDIILRDRSTGTRYELYVSDGNMAMNEVESDVSEDGITLKDRATGIKYDIYVSDGKLTIVEAEE